MWSQCIVDGHCESVGGSKHRVRGHLTLKRQVTPLMLSELLAVHPLQDKTIAHNHNYTHIYIRPSTPKGQTTIFNVPSVCMTILCGGLRKHVQMRYRLFSTHSGIFLQSIDR